MSSLPDTTFLESRKRPLVTVTVECGIGSCLHRYPLQVKPKARHYLKCPKCGNTTLQVILG